MKNSILNIHEGNLYLGGDRHTAQRDANMKKVDEMFDNISRDRKASAYIDTGDIVDAVGPYDKRFNVEGQGFIEGLEDVENPTKTQLLLATISKSVKYAKHQMDGIKNLPSLFIIGNHEMEIIKKGWNPYDHLLDERPKWTCGGYVSMVYLPHDAFIVTHGHGGPRSDGGKVNVLHQISKDFDGISSVFAGHTHALGTWPTYKMCPNPKTHKFEKKKIMLTYCGAFLETYTDSIIPSYGELKNYTPLGIGYIKCKVEGGRITHIEPIHLD